MATEVIHSVGTGGDYTTLTAWEAAQQRDLVAADEIAVAEISETLVGNYPTFELKGWTADHDHPCVIRAAAGFEYDHVTDTGAKLISTGAYGFVNRSNQVLHCYDICINFTTMTYGNFTYDSAWLEHLFDRCTFLNNSDLTIGLVSKGFIRNSIVFCNLPGDGEVKNCTVENSTIIMTNGAGYGGNMCTWDCLCTNVVAYNSTAKTSYNIYYNPRSASNYNAQNDNGSSPPPGANSITGITTADFVDYAGGNYHLASDSQLIGAGTNLYANFQTDTDGDTWPSSGAWDIGADYYVAAGGSTVEASFTSSSSSSYIGQLKHNSIFDSVSDSISAYNGTLKQYGLFNSDSVSGSSYNSRVIQSGLFSSAVSSGNSYTGQIKQYGLLNSVAVSSVTFNGSLSNNLTGAFASAASSTAVYNGQLVHSGLFNSVSSSSASFNGSLNGVFTGEFSSYSVSAASYQGNLKQYGLYSSGSTSSILFNGKTVFYGSFDSVSSSSASFTGSLDSSKHGLFNSVSLSSFAATSKQVLYSVFNSSSSSLVTFVPESAHTTAPAKRTINVNQSNRVITSSTNNRTITVN